LDHSGPIINMSPMGRKTSLPSQLSSSSPMQGENKKFCYARGTARHSCQYRLESWTYRVALFVWSYIESLCYKIQNDSIGLYPASRGNESIDDDDDDQDAIAAQW